MLTESRVDVLKQFPRVLLGHYPTPFELMPRLSEQFSAQFHEQQIFIKRDDCTGLGLGGNKVRQLEYYLGDALSQGCDTVLSTGAIQSNYMRTLAAAASKLGLESHIQLENRVPKNSREYNTSGNRLLTEMFGATLYYYPEGEDEEGADREIRNIAEGLKRQGKSPYVVPLAPVKFPRGALGYIEAADEMHAQMDGQLSEKPHDLVVVPSGSGLTHVGTLFGLRLAGNNVPVLGACVRRSADLQRQRIMNYCANLAEAIGVENPVSASDVWVDDRALAPGYGQISAAVKHAIQTLATREGILLDPVYSGKTMACLLLLLESGEMEQYKKIVFLHSGGAPAVFAYQQDLQTQ